MTTSLLTLTPDLSVGTAARMLAERGVSGAPVVDAQGCLLGMLTEGDLIRRLAAVTDKPRSWFLSLFGSAPAQADHYARSHGRKVRDVMTAEVETVTEDTPVAEVAALLERRAIRRVPVVHDGKLRGIVSRADLLKVSLAEPMGTSGGAASDREIAQALSQAMRDQPWIDAYFIFPEVRDGVVTIHGYCRSEDVQRGLRVLAEGIPGVREVRVVTEPTPLPLIGGL
ncbi:CBS domain-containing protein [Roseicella aerolata]|uniref:CBS domain-containing protein n=1 Tax=Roseicella aerolata TaxID=2883479 RepID=A0A9X1IHD5_9PROT|nr:CBS domain-containing protein [Roseicella aerolata]MCB4824607.1 CBS domain-containing protein [Roseicella aerolata]